jgi:hypothetical protein
MNVTEGRTMSVADGARQSHLDDARCADLALGLMPGHERERALVHAAECPACEARLKAHAAAGARARAMWRERATRVVRGGVPVRRSARPGWGIAAAVLALAVAVPLLRPHPARDAGAWLPPMGDAVRTREGEVSDARLAAGLAAYQARDLAAADRELSRARAQGGAEQVRRLYLAHVKLALGQPHAAVALLRGVEWRGVPEPWRRDGVALFARALRADGVLGEADSLERALRTVPPGTPFVP